MIDIKNNNKRFFIVFFSIGSESVGIRMTPSSFLAKNNATLSTIRSHHRPNNNSTCTTDNSIITI